MSSLTNGLRLALIVGLAGLAACGDMGAKPEMPMSVSVVAARLAPSGTAKVLEGSLVAAKASGYEDIGELRREKVSTTCWSDEKCVLDHVSQCPARVLKPWLQDGLLESARRGHASALLVDSEWQVSLNATSKHGKCLQSKRGPDRYVVVCKVTSGVSVCHSENWPQWYCAENEHIPGRECVERSHAVLLTDDHAAVAFLRVVAAADERHRKLRGGQEQIGYIDANGRYVIPPRFDLAGDFSQGRAVAGQLVDGKWPRDACWYHLIDKLGRPQPSQGCPKVGRFDSGLIRSTLDSAKPLAIGGYMGLDGTMRLPAFEVLTEDFSEGLAAVRDLKTHSCGFIDTNGRFVVPLGRFYQCSPFAEGRAAVALSGTVTKPGLLGPKFDVAPRGFIDRTGQLVLPAVYETAGAFSEGWAFVIHQGKAGFINQAGDMVLQLPEWSNKQELRRSLEESLRKAPFEFHEGLARMSDKPGQVGFIDRTGRFVIAPLYSDTREFREGLAPVAVTTASGITLWGYIRKDGSWAIEPRFFIANAFHEGLAVAGTLVKER